MTRNIFATNMFKTVLALVLLGTAVPVWCAEPVPAARLLVPADAAVADSRKLIRDAFDADYKAARESGEPTSLIDRLRKEADSAPQPAKKYAFLLEAEDVAEQHDDAAATLAIVDRRAELFDVDCLAERSKTLARLAGPKIVADLVLLEQATATATKAAAAERFDIAAESANLAIKIAQAIDREQKSAARRRTQRRPAVNEVVPAANGVALIKSAIDLQKQIGKQKALFTKYEESQAVLATQPDDPAANAAAGTYLCFVAQKWDQGLPRLKRSQLPLFSVLARDELGIDGSDPAPKKVFELAGRWWDAADDKSLTNDERTSIQKHASRLYAVLRPKLSDPLEIRIAETRGATQQGPPSDEVRKHNGNTETSLAVHKTDKHWTILFRSDNPAHWDARVNTLNAYSAPLTSIPNGIRFLRLTNIANNESVIVEVTNEQITRTGPVSQAYGWSGGNLFFREGYHLGIYRLGGECDLGQISIATGAMSGRPPVGDFWGWGFGHKTYADDRQYYSWNGRTVPKTIFEIAVTTGDLAASEKRLLLMR